MQAEELERRNRTLTDKLNSQIYSHAADYKEKTSQVLSRDPKSRSPLRDMTTILSRKSNTNKMSPLRQKSPQ